MILLRPPRLAAAASFTKMKEAENGAGPGGLSFFVFISSHQCGTLMSFGQFANAFLPIFVERPHIITFSRLEQPSKA